MGLQTPLQHGFRKNSLIDSAVFQFLENISKNEDNKKIPVMIFWHIWLNQLDLVPHCLFLKKLRRYGVRVTTGLNHTLLKGNK